VVTDLGVNAAGVLPGVPTLYVDHHQPTGAPEAPAVVASGYGWDPVPNSSWLMWELLAPLAEAAGAPVDDLLWVAAVGTVSDLGEKAPWPRLAGSPEAVHGEVAQGGRVAGQRGAPRERVRRRHRA
jgi:single-stranded-DNA-specific exonuclease